MLPKRLSARYWLDEATFGLQAAFQGEAREEKKIIRFPGAAGEEGGGERRGLRLGNRRVGWIFVIVTWW